MKHSPSFPHIFSWRTSAKAIWICILALVPGILWSLSLFGPRTGLIWIAAAASATLAELAINLFRRQRTLSDGSAMLTGILVAFAMPPGVPLYIPAASAAFAIVVVKGLFGGLGSNWMNPALGGIAFAFVNWPVAMKDYLLPRMIAGVDGLSAATPLAFARSLAPGEGIDILQNIQRSGFPVSALDSKLTATLNAGFFDHLGAQLPGGYVDLILGIKPGALGDCALFFILIGSIALLAFRIIRFEAPLAMLLTFSVLVRVFGTGLSGYEFLNGNLLFSLCTGSFLFCAFFCATDPVTSPISSIGLYLYGFVVGGLSFLFFRWGTSVEGSAFAVLAANILVPWLDGFFLPKMKHTLRGDAI